MKPVDPLVSEQKKTSKNNVKSNQKDSTLSKIQVENKQNDARLIEETREQNGIPVDVKDDKISENHDSESMVKSVHVRPIQQKKKAKERSILEEKPYLNVRSTVAANKKNVRNVRSTFTRTLLLADDTDSMESSDSACVSQGAAVVDETIMLMRQLVTPLVTSCPRWMEDDNSVFSSPNIMSPALSGISEVCLQITDFKATIYCSIHFIN
jgi:hypothetical protein